MKRLIICRGIPASGKSTWAAQQFDAITVTRDDIRVEYDCIGTGWSPEKERNFVIPEMETRIVQALRAGCTVISADTNLNPTVVARLMYLAQICEAPVEIKEFDTPLEVCIERDSQREYPWKVGEAKLREYHKKWMKRDAIPT